MLSGRDCARNIGEVAAERIGRITSVASVAFLALSAASCSTPMGASRSVVTTTTAHTAPKTSAPSSPTTLDCGPDAPQNNWYAGDCPWSKGNNPNVVCGQHTPAFEFTNGTCPYPGGYTSFTTTTTTSPAAAQQYEQQLQYAEMCNRPATHGEPNVDNPDGLQRNRDCPVGTPAFPFIYGYGEGPVNTLPLP